MDFVYVDDVARANICALASGRVRRGVQRRRAASRRASTNWPRRSSRVDGRDGVRPSTGPERSGQRRAAPAAPSTREGPSGCSAFSASVPLDEGLRRAGRRGGAPAARARMTTTGGGDSRRAAVARRARGRGGAPRHPVGWVTQGPEVAAFEREFAAAVGRPHACAVSSCTTALHLALLACGVGPGDEVVTVSHSFIATANADPLLRRDAGVRGHRARTRSTWTRRCSRRAITPRTKAILCVHQLGHAVRPRGDRRRRAARTACR